MWYVLGKAARQAQLLISTKQRQTLNLSVSIQHGRQPVVQHILPNPPARLTYSVWLTKQRTGDSTQLTAKKYIKIVQASVLQGLRKRKQPGSSDVPRASLLHDRDPAHQSKEFAAFAERSGIRVAVLPLRSPVLEYEDPVCPPARTLLHTRPSFLTKPTTRNLLRPEPTTRGLPHMEPTTCGLLQTRPTTHAAYYTRPIWSINRSDFRLILHSISNIYFSLFHPSLLFTVAALQSL